MEEIEREFRYFRIYTPTDKNDALLIFGGKDIACLEKISTRLRWYIGRIPEAEEEITFIFSAQKKQIFGKIFVSQIDFLVLWDHGFHCGTLKLLEGH